MVSTSGTAPGTAPKWRKEKKRIKKQRWKRWYQPQARNVGGFPSWSNDPCKCRCLRTLQSRPSQLPAGDKYGQAVAASGFGKKCKIFGKQSSQESDFVQHMAWLWERGPTDAGYRWKIGASLILVLVLYSVLCIMYSVICIGGRLEQV